MAKIPFNIKYRPQIESGEYKVVNSYGEPVRIICWDARIDFPNGIRPIISLQLIDEKYEVVSNHLKNGKIYSFKDAPADLFIVTPDEEPRKFKIKVSEFAEAYNLAATDFNSEEYKACDGNLQLIIDKYATALLDLAREQFIKDGYVIEKKAFHDAVEKVPPEVMKEVSDNVDKANEEEPTEFEKFMDKVVDDTIRETYSEDGFYDICRDALALAEKEIAKGHEHDVHIPENAYYKQLKKQWEEGYDKGKVEALKDLPRWEPNQVSYSEEPVLCNGNTILNLGRVHIHIDQLTKLPGFKENEK